MRGFGTAAAAVVVLGCAARVASAQESSTHEGHDHGEHFEQIAVYDMTAGVHSLVAVGNVEDSTVGEESLAFMIVPAASADNEGLEGAEHDAEAAWEAFSDGESEPTAVTAGESVSPSESVVYQVALADPLVMVQLDIVDGGAYALILEHGTDEVPVAVTSPSGVVLVAAFEEEEEDHDDHDDHEGEEEDHDDHDHEEEGEDDSPATSKQWVNALVASVVLSLCSLAGLLIVVSGRVAHSIDLSHACIFASGALLTASLLHIVPEALEGLESKYDNLHDLGLYAGVAILGGMSFGVLMHAVLEANHRHGQHQSHDAPDCGGGDGASTPADVAEKSRRGEQSLVPASSAAIGQAPVDGVSSIMEAGKDVDVTQPPSPAVTANNVSGKNLLTLIEARKGRAWTDITELEPICWNLIVGDLVHNFADGVTIGAAFLGCSLTMGWTVTASAVLHEVPHELADFMALINGGMSMTQAFIYNFLSALSCVLGVVIILALRESLSSADVSFILLVGGGSFIFIALSELVPAALTAPSVKAGQRSALHGQVLKLCSFVVGAAIIGIPLIFDQHCEADGHNH